MKIILDYKDGKYIMRRIFKNKEGRLVRTRTNKYERISNYIDNLELPESALLIRLTDSFRYVYDNGDSVIFKNAEKVLEMEETNEQCNIYTKTLKRIKKEKIHTSITLLDVNKRLIALLLAGATLVGGIALARSRKDKPDPQPTTTVETQANNTLPTDSFIVTVPTTHITSEITTPAPTPSPIVPEKNFNLEHRIQQTLDIREGAIENNSIIPIGTRLDNWSFNKIVNFLQSKEAKYFFEAGEKYGVDPYLLIAIAMAESSLNHDSCIPGGNNYNGYGVGIMQIESPELGAKYRVYNYLTNEYETIVLNMEGAMDLKTCIDWGAGIWQTRLHEFNNSNYIALQSYNYGVSGMKAVINEYARESGQTYDEILSDREDIGWVDYAYDLHENPQKYFPNWQYKKYGNPNYVSDVLGFYIGIISENKLPDGTICYTNLLTGENTYMDVDVKESVKTP